ncbi:MAG: hypothetical protein KatS3mg129_0420 [Leptospiraceae bacterium]|nr:MAG: hypothetical protein KatS3mg129_0420 [Leptospiraceae bacterium]
MKKIIILLIILSNTIFPENWIKVYKDKEIQVWTRKTNSPIDEFKAEIIINQPIQIVAAVLLDIDNHFEWVPDCKLSKIIKQLKEFDFIQYYQMDYPWPVDDRDLYIISKTKINLNNDTITIRSTALNDYPLKPGYIRITEYQSSWDLIKINDVKTKVLYQSYVHPAGSISPSLANYFIKNTPIKLLKGLKKQSNHIKYKEMGNHLLKKINQID